MFKNKGKEAAANASNSSTAPSGATNTITTGTNIEGAINASSDIRIDGSLKGSLTCKGRVIIGSQGVIEGDINCQNAIIEGRFSGNLKVTEILNVKDSAHVDGEIETGKLKIEPGAVFNGTCSMGGQKLKSIPMKEKQA